MSGSELNESFEGSARRDGVGADGESTVVTDIDRQEDFMLDLQRTRTKLLGYLFHVYHRYNKKRRPVRRSLAILLIIFQLAELLPFFVNPAYVASSLVDTLWPTVKYFHFWRFLGRASISTWRGVSTTLSITVLVLVAAILLSGHLLKKKRANLWWSKRVVASSCFGVWWLFQVLYFQVYLLLIQNIKCTRSGNSWSLDVFPESNCWDANHLSLIFPYIFAIVCLAIVSCVSALLSNTEKTYSKCRWSVRHTEFELQLLVAKLIIGISELFLPEYPFWHAMVPLLLFGRIGFLFIERQPMEWLWVNSLRAASMVAVAWMGFSLLILDTVTFDGSDFEEAVGFVMIFGAVGIGLVTCAACILRQRLYTLERSISNLDGPIEAWAIDKRLTENEIRVSLLARIPNSVVKSGTGLWPSEREKDMLQKYEQIVMFVLEQSLLSQPNSIWINLLFGKWHFDSKNNPELAQFYVDKARRLKPNFAHSFSIFVHDTEKAQFAKSTGMSLTEGMSNIASYVEFSNQYKVVQRSFRKLTQAFRKFWRLMLTDNVSPEGIAKSLKDVDGLQRRTEALFKQLLKKWPRSVKLLRAYGTFVEEVKQDALTAQRFFKEADSIEDETAEARRRGLTGDGGAQSSDALAHIDDKKDAMIIADETGIMQTVNGVASKMFGYKKEDMIGKNLNILMVWNNEELVVSPEPYSTQHSSFLREYLRTGRSSVLGNVRAFEALHSKGHIFPVTLNANRIDSSHGIQFVGVLRPSEDLDAVISCDREGMITSVNKTCLKMFGYKNVDAIVGKNVKVLMPTKDARDHDAHMQRYLSSGVAHVVGTIGRRLKGRRSDGKVFNISLGLTESGSGASISFTARIRNVQDESGMVTINSTGKVLNCNKVALQLVNCDKESDLVGHNINSILPTPYSQFHSSYLKRYLRTGIPKVISNSRVVPVASKAGTIVYVHLDVAQVGSGDSSKQFENKFVARVTPMEKTEGPQYCTLTLDASDGIVESYKAPSRHYDILGVAGTMDLTGMHVSAIIPELHDLEILREMQSGSAAAMDAGPSGTVHPFPSKPSFPTQITRLSDGEPVLIAIRPAGEIQMAGSTKFKLISLASLEGVITWDTGGRVVACTSEAAMLFGFEIGDLLGMHLSTLFESDQKDHVAEIISRFSVDRPSKLRPRRFRLVGRFSNGATMAVIVEPAVMRPGEKVLGGRAEKLREKNWDQSSHSEVLDLGYEAMTSNQSGRLSGKILSSRQSDQLSFIGENATLIAMRVVLDTTGDENDDDLTSYADGASRATGSVASFLQLRQDQEQLETIGEVDETGLEDSIPAQNPQREEQNEQPQEMQVMENSETTKTLIQKSSTSSMGSAASLRRIDSKSNLTLRRQQSSGPGQLHLLRAQSKLESKDGDLKEKNRLVRTLSWISGQSMNELSGDGTDSGFSSMEQQPADLISFKNMSSVNSERSGDRSRVAGAYDDDDLDVAGLRTTTSSLTSEETHPSDCECSDCNASSSEYSASVEEAANQSRNHLPLLSQQPKPAITPKKLNEREGLASQEITNPTSESIDQSQPYSKKQSAPKKRAVGFLLTKEQEKSAGSTMNVLEKSEQGLRDSSIPSDSSSSSDQDALFAITHPNSQSNVQAANKKSASSLSQNKRQKQIVKLLGRAKSKRLSAALRTRTKWGLALSCIVHVVFFGTLRSLSTTTQLSVHRISKSGRALNLAQEMASRTYHAEFRNDLASSSFTLQKLGALSNELDNILDDMYVESRILSAAGGSSSDNQIAQAWLKKSLAASYKRGDQITLSDTSPWELAKRIVLAANRLSSLAGTNVTGNADALAIRLNVYGLLTPEMENVMELEVSKFRNVVRTFQLALILSFSIQLAVILFVTFVLIIPMMASATKYRLSIFIVFFRIPKAVMKSLSQKTVSLDDSGSDDDKSDSSEDESEDGGDGHVTLVTNAAARPKEPTGFIPPSLRGLSTIRNNHVPNSSLGETAKQATLADQGINPELPNQTMPGSEKAKLVLKDFIAKQRTAKSDSMRTDDGTLTSTFSSSAVDIKLPNEGVNLDMKNNSFSSRMRKRKRKSSSIKSRMAAHTKMSGLKRGFQNEASFLGPVVGTVIIAISLSFGLAFYLSEGLKQPASDIRTFRQATYWSQVAYHEHMLHSGPLSSVYLAKSPLLSIVNASVLLDQAVHGGGAIDYTDASAHRSSLVSHVLLRSDTCYFEDESSDPCTSISNDCSKAHPLFCQAALDTVMKSGVWNLWGEYLQLSATPDGQQISDDNFKLVERIALQSLIAGSSAIIDALIKETSDATYWDSVVQSLVMILFLLQYPITYNLHAKPMTKMLERESSRSAMLLNQLPAYVSLSKLFAKGETGQSNPSEGQVQPKMIMSSGST